MANKKIFLVTALNTDWRSEVNAVDADQAWLQYVAANKVTIDKSNFKIDEAEYCVRTSIVNAPKWAGKYAVNVFRGYDRIRKPVIVEKGSRDKAVEIATQLANDKRCKVLVHDHEHGYSFIVDGTKQ